MHEAFYKKSRSCHGVAGLWRPDCASISRPWRIVFATWYRQTKARIFGGLTKLPDKLVSLFEPHTEIIRKGKAGKPNEFGKLVQLQEAENQIITHYEVYDRRPADQRLLIPAVEAHQRKLGRVPRLVAADAGYYSRANEEAVREMGVDYLSIPNRSTRSEERRKLEKRRWFKEGPSVAHRM
jgi:IS5 family transposase